MSPATVASRLRCAIVCLEPWSCGFSSRPVWTTKTCSTRWGASADTDSRRRPAQARPKAPGSHRRKCDAPVCGNLVDRPRRSIHVIRFEIQPESSSQAGTIADGTVHTLCCKAWRVGWRGRSCRELVLLLGICKRSRVAKGTKGQDLETIQVD